MYVAMHNVVIIVVDRLDTMLAFIYDVVKLIEKKKMGRQERRGRVMVVGNDPVVVGNDA